jgi:hypothetical protein
MSVVFSGSSTNKTDPHDIAEIVLKVALNIIKQTTIKINWEKQFTIVKRGRGLNSDSQQLNQYQQNKMIPSFRAIQFTKHLKII